MNETVQIALITAGFLALTNIAVAWFASIAQGRKIEKVAVLQTEKLEAVQVAQTEAVAIKLDEQTVIAKENFAVVEATAKDAASAVAAAAVKTETIHTLVNSNLQEAIRAAEQANREKDDALKENARLLAIIATAKANAEKPVPEAPPKPKRSRRK